MKTRWKKKFAWWPTAMGSGYVQKHQGKVVWLETYWELQYFYREEWTPYLNGTVWTQMAFKREEQSDDPPELTEVDKVKSTLIKLNVLGIGILAGLWMLNTLVRG